MNELMELRQLAQQTDTQKAVSLYNKVGKEIERLNNSYKLMEQALEDKADEIDRLHSIIKEVREYIEDKYAVILADDLFLDRDERIERKRLLEIIGILDKE